MNARMGLVEVGIIVLFGSLLGPGPAALAATNESVVGSPHDLCTGAATACESCHGPADASGSFLWAREVNTGGGAFSGLKARCYGCHDGSVTSVGSYVFSTSASTYSHVVTPLATGETPHGDDCDRCHDPHDDSNGKFLIVAADADVCSDCHQTGECDHPKEVLTDFPHLRAWDPAASPEVTGTRLWNAGGTAVVSSGAAYIKCETCHAPHGARTPELNAMSTTGSAICINCHS